MTISTTASRISHNGNGATTAFSFPYLFLANADLVVIKVAADGTETTLVLNTGYTVTGAGDDAGGTVTIIGTAPASGTRIVIYRSMAITQEVDYITGDAFPAETHERALDRLTLIAQQQQDAIDRCAKLSETSTADADTLIANINTLAAIDDDVSAVAAIDTDVSAVAAIDSNVTTVAGIAANVTTVAGIAANVTTVAGNATNINTVAGDIADVSTVAADIADVSTVAANIADIQNAEENATAAATSASAAATSASSASSSASAASTSATNAASSASAASTSASNASSSASAASTSASNASSSATAAASSAAAAAASLDSFDDRYLGAKSSDPTLDNDGNALVTGALYYNTTSQTMKVYDGANWITATAAGTTSMNVYKYVATAGQTTFSGAATVGGTMSYTSGNIIVFLNGAALDSTDYTATNGTSVVLGSAASLNDEVVVVAFKSFTVADTYTQSAADAEFLRKAGEDGVTVSSGNVGIGTSSPTNKLSVNGGAHFLGGSSGFPTTGVGIEVVGAGNTGTNYIQAYNRDNATWQTLAINSELTTFGTGGAERVRISANGAVGIGSTSNGSGLTIANVGGNGWLMNTIAPVGSNYTHAVFTNSNGNIGSITTNGSTTAFNTSSDYRLKENIQPMSNALATIAQLKPVTYTWKVDGSFSQGFIAHELQEVVPDCVTGDKDGTRIEQYEIIPAVPATFDDEGNELTPAVEAVMGEREVPVYQGVDASFLIATLTAAIQEQQAIIEQLKADVAELKGQA